MKPYLISGHTFLVLYLATNEEQAVKNFKDDYPELAERVCNVELAQKNARFFIDWVDYKH